ncbi:peripheral myelin protein 22-like [Chiloscyllium punctatum]|uniref:peripheral myelin protein 22-like n=1 Tax=Chiloscyllium punctatum TaxID=137246 RepID=UPI003B639373
MMSPLLPMLLLLHLAGLVLLYIATIHNAWWVPGEGQSRDLWSECVYSQSGRQWACTGFGPAGPEDWLHASQALMVVSVLFSSGSLLSFLCQLYTLRKGSLFYLTGILQVFAGLCVLVSALIYTLHERQIHGAQTQGSFGYSYILAWLSFPLTVCSGIMYIHLRKLD